MSLSEIYYFRYFNGILGADLGVFCTSSITINAVSLYKIRNFYVSDAGLTCNKFYPSDVFLQNTKFDVIVQAWALFIVCRYNIKSTKLIKMQYVNVRQ